MTWDEITDWIDDVLGKIEDLPERAEDFKESVQEKVESINQQVEEREFITKRQVDAVANIEDGVDRWLNH